MPFEVNRRKFRRFSRQSLPDAFLIDKPGNRRKSFVNFGFKERQTADLSGIVVAITRKLVDSAKVFAQ